MSKTKFKSRDFIFIHKSKKPFRHDHLNDWLQTAIAIVAKKMDIKLDPSIYTAHTLKQAEFIDMASQGVPSWRIQMIERWSSNKWKKMYINADWRDTAKLSCFSVSTLMDQMKSQSMEN